MVIVHITGGLGNQMFQYACARRLAHVNGGILKLDITSFGKIKETNTSRQYELGALNIIKDFAAPEEVERLKKNAKGFLGFFGMGGKTYIRERHYRFDSEILNLRGSVYLEGYWQSEKYFKDIEDVIRKDFTFKTEPGGINGKIAKAVSNAESVSVHIRRGDYVANPKVNRDFGVCPPEYYKVAIEKIAEKVKDPRFFVFSDDIAWAKENLKITHPVNFMDQNGPDKAYEDMRLMSLCKHHVIANSSFSWWGAWLCKNPKKIVIAPEKWFNKKELDTRDLIPEKWIRV
ncbi:MAG: alpha-1,2-fucosyltransferase [Thermodesulfobacteriota bacterium]